jgi:hypothetical protein
MPGGLDSGYADVNLTGDCARQFLSALQALSYFLSGGTGLSELIGTNISQRQMFQI